ncbi:MAG: hypothetical protein ACXIUW_01700 [Roseinatronobacter sp.]
MIRYCLAVSALALQLSAAQAQTNSDTDPSDETGVPSVLERLDSFLRGFLAEVEPQLRDLEQGLTALEPELQRFLSELRGMAQYHAPEFLPNGDILIRRRQPGDADEDAPEAPSPEPEVDPLEL